MKKTQSLFAVLAASAMMCSAAQHQISSFREVTITHGETATIGGVACSEPDVYYVDKGDGTWEAVRLTVAPAGPSEITVPYLNMCTPEGITVNWKTSKQTTAPVVNYGLSPDALTGRVEAEHKMLNGRTYCWNTARLSGLQPGTVYYYQVDCDGLKSEVYSFRTFPEAGSRDVMRVLVVGDHQRNEHSDYEWLLAAARRTAAQKWGGSLEDNVSVLMNVGDQVDAGGDLSLYETVHLYKSRSVSPTLPIMTAVGNHEYKRADHSDGGDLTNYTSHFGGYGAMEYQGITSGTAAYYAYQAGTVLFVVLDSDRTTAEQKSWVRRVVAAAAADPTVDFLVSIQHRPLYAEQWCNDVSQWMNTEIMPILSSTPKHVLDLAGHHHLYARGQMTNTPVYHVISGGGVGTTVEGYEQLWDGKTPDNRNADEVQKTIDQWTYQLIEFDPVTKEMTVECYSVGNRRLALDNELVDSFSRNILDTTASATPSVKTPDGAVELPCTFVQQGVGEEPYSVQYQVSRTDDFADILVSRLVNAEDYYGADDDYRPLDLNRDLDIREMTVDAGNVLSNGDYYFRVRNRNANLVWSEYSEPVRFTVRNSQVGAVSVEGRFFKTGSQVSVGYAGAPVGTGAWLAVYDYFTQPGGGDSYRWGYTDAADGEMSFAIDRPGTYYATLFKDGGYDECAARVWFVVSDNADSDHQPSIASDRKVYAEGDPIRVILNNAPCIDRDWVGLYDYSVENVKNGKSYSYAYAGTDPQGSVTLNVAGNYNYTTPVTAGLYFVTYCMQDDYLEPMKRAELVVGKPVMVETDRAEYNVGETVSALYVGAPGWETDRICVVGADGSLSEYETSGRDGHVSLAGLEAGAYELCLTTNGGKEISARVSFAVTGKSGMDAKVCDVVSVSVTGKHLRVSKPTIINSVTVYSTDGKCFASPAVAGTTVSFDVDAPAGVYLLDVDGRVSKIVL